MTRGIVVLDHGVADLGPRPDDDVQDAGRQAGLLEDLRDQQSAGHGVSSAGLSTTAFPTASAGATERWDRYMGKFQGLMTPTTPAGRR